jgi:flagellar protein FlaI
MLKSEIGKSLALMAEVQLEPAKRAAINYFIERDIIGLGKIEPLMQDESIEDISCDGTSIPIFIYHRDPKIGPLKTNIVFTDTDELNTFVVKVSQKCNKTISIAEPLLDGALHDGSRVQATLGTDIARKGSNFTIRKFTARPLTPTHMLQYKTINSLALAYLWLAIDNGMSVLLSGGTATGKTSLLNALSLFIRPNLKIVSIEDTAELRLPHPHWIPEVARTPLSIKGRIGEVSLFDLLKSSMRQRPDYIVLGEVRGKEAFVLFQQMATGHPSMATIHAASLPQLVDRLTTPPINLPPTLLENINIVAFLVLSKIKGSYVRRVNNILEIVGVEKNRPLTNSVFAWNPMDDTFEIKGKSVVLEMIAKKMGMTEDSIKEELSRRKKVLEWMVEKGIDDYRDVAVIFSIYYSNPERIVAAIREVQ